jgi:hypothetical protein
MALDQGVLDAVTNSNFKAMAELPIQNAIAHQNRLNMIAEASVGQILNLMNGLDPAEAVSTTKVIEADLQTVKKAIADMGAIVAGLQQLMKGAQTTPPPTA